jgi:hypothetical protein
VAVQHKKFLGPDKRGDNFSQIARLKHGALMSEEYDAFGPIANMGM